MPLEFVTSNAGHPMLIIDRYTFHRHSFNPKTGRTNWRCSRRRVRDIRCTSSCYSVDETASVPSPHHLSCLALSDSELMTYRIKAEKYNSQSLNKLNSTVLTDGHNNIDLDDTYNTDSFQNREVDSDEEELNVVLNDFDNVIKDEIDSDNQDDANVNGEDGRESVDSQMYPETGEDLTEPSNTISGIIESNKKLLDHIKSKMNTFMESQQQGSQQQNSNQNSSSCSSTSSMSFSNNTSIRQSNSSNNPNKSIFFVTSKVGHPMLVVDNYTFHKHSTNPKTNRINWRCARRRVKDIRCSSSCYTVDGVFSNPTRHDAKCFPLTDEMLRIYQNKRDKNNNLASGFKNTINTKADSFTTLKNKVNINNNAMDSGSEANNNSNNKQTDSSECETNNGYSNRYSMPIYQMYRNKRKENQPVRSNETSEDRRFSNDTANASDLAVEQNGHDSHNSFVDVGEDLYFDNDIESDDCEMPDGSMFESYGFETETDNTGALGDDIDAGQEIGDTDNKEDANDLHDLPSYSSSSPESMSKLIDELKRMKQKELVYIERIKNSKNEITRIRKISSEQIQALRWKSKMLEIDMLALRSNINQKNLENSSLKKLVDEMMSKLK